jgi:hypothetical protein
MISQARSISPGFRVGVQHVLYEEALVAMRERGRIGGHAVVRAAQRREVQLARLAGAASGRVPPHQLRDRVGGQGAAEELRLAELRPWPLLLAVAGQRSLRLPVRQPAVRGALGVGADAEERPAKQCPPLRAATCTPDRRANAIVSATSSGVRQRTTAVGRTSQKRVIAGLRTRS